MYFVQAFLRTVNVVQKQISEGGRKKIVRFIRKVHVRLINILKLGVRSLDQVS